MCAHSYNLLGDGEEKCSATAALFLCGTLVSCQPWEFY